MIETASQIKKGIVISYTSIALNILSGFLYTPWLIRKLGSSDYAVYAIVISVMAYLTVDFGIGATVMRFVARYRAEGRGDKIAGLMGVTVKLYLLIDAVLLAALIAVYGLMDVIYANMTPAELEKLRVVYVMMGLFSVVSVPFLPLNGVFMAHGRVYNIKAFDVIGKLSAIGLVGAALLLDLGLYAVVLINAAVAALINVSKLVFLKKVESLEIRIRYRDRALVRQIFGFSVWVAVAMIADKFLFAIEPTLLGAFSNSRQVAIFAVAASIEGYVLIFAEGMSGVFLPRVTQMVVAKADRERTTDLMIMVGRVQLVIVSLFVFGILSQGREFILYWVGETYLPAYDAVVIILLPCLIHLSQGIGTEMTFATNHVRYRALSYGIGGILNVAVTIALCPGLGATGAAIGIAAGFFVGQGLIMNIVYSKKMSLNMPRFFQECHGRMLLPALLSLLWGEVVRRLFVASSLAGAMTKCVLWGAGFAALVWLLFMNGREKGLVKSMLRRVLGRLGQANA